MNFKDMIQSDLDFVFFNSEEFAESHNINGKVVSCIVDNDRLIERSKKEFDGIYVGELLIFVRKEEIKGKLSQGMPLIYDNRQMNIFSVREDEGMYEIILNANAGV